jgi:hypothetical protein
MPLIETRGSSSALAYGLNSFKLISIPYNNVEDASSDGVVAYFPASSSSDTSSRVGSASATLYGVTSASNSTTGGNGWNRGTVPSNGIYLTSMPVLDNHTFSFWYRCTDTQIHSLTDGAPIMWYNDNAVTGAGSVLWGFDGGSTPTSTSNTRDLRFGGEGWVTDGQVVGTIVQNAWNNLLYTKSGSSWVAYLNGTQVATRTETFTQPFTSGLWFGNYNRHGGNDNRHYGAGVYDEFIMWNRVLTSTQVSTYYSNALTNGLITSIGRI